MKNVDNKEETCEEKIAKLELEVQEWKNSYTRKLAEFMNFTKRKETEVSEMKKICFRRNNNKNFLKILIIWKELKMLLLKLKNFDALVEGVNMILRNLKYMLSEEGVEEVEAGEGVKF